MVPCLLKSSAKRIKEEVAKSRGAQLDTVWGISVIPSDHPGGGGGGETLALSPGQKTTGGRRHFPVTVTSRVRSRSGQRSKLCSLNFGTWAYLPK